MTRGHQRTSAYLRSPSWGGGGHLGSGLGLGTRELLIPVLLWQTGWVRRNMAALGLGGRKARAWCVVWRAPGMELRKIVFWYRASCGQARAKTCPHYRKEVADQRMMRRPARSTFYALRGPYHAPSKSHDKSPPRAPVSRLREAHQSPHGLPVAREYTALEQYRGSAGDYGGVVCE